MPLTIWADLQRDQWAQHGSTYKVPGRAQFGHLPIVYRFGGREWVLDDDAQQLAFTVSNRYTCRHHPKYGQAYAYYVLLLASKLSTDPTTAGSIARWVCPDGCTVLRCGERVVRVVRHA